MAEASVQKIAVPLIGDKFSTHFGQSTGFAVFEVDPAQKKIVGRRDFPLLGHHGCGFGEWLREKGVGVLIVGGIGPGAVANLEAADIAVCAGDPRRDVESLVRACLEGGLAAAEANCDHGHGQGHGHGHGHEGACHCHSHRHGP